MKDALLGFMLHHGYMALYAVLTLGIVGLPLPDETVMLFFGSLTFFGPFSLYAAILAGFLGSLSGMMISYLIGRKAGRLFLQRCGRWVFLTPGRLDKAEAWFNKYGVWSVGFGCFIPGIRHVSCYLSGMSGVPLWKHTAFAGAGALLWCVVFLSAGHYIGATGHDWIAFAHRYADWAAAAVVAFVLIAVWDILRRRKQV